MKLILIFLTFFLIETAFGQERSRLPLFVLIERDPWRWIIGSDSPSFALYTDGLIIYRDKQSREEQYYYCQLTHSETDSLAAFLNYRSLDTLDQYYEAATMTDQPTNIFLCNVGEGLNVVTVYGHLLNETPGVVPQQLISLYKRAFNYQNPRGTKWLPEKIELMIQPMLGKGKPAPWPKDWPNLESSDTRGGSDLYSLYLPREHFPEFLKLRQSKKEGQYFLISDKQWHITVRYPFPEEDIWMQ